MLRIGIEQIAGLARVSVGTVDRALHGRKGISEETRERILKIARELGYETNWAARALARGQASIRIGVCIPSAFESFYGEIRDGIFDEVHRFRQFGIEVLYEPIDRPGDNEIEALREMSSQGVNAIIMTPGDPAVIGPEIDATERKGIRVVCVASDAASSSRSTVVCVQPELNGNLAAEILAMITPPKARVAAVVGILTTEDQRLKTRAFSEAFPRWNEGGEMVAVVEGHDDEQETSERCAALIRREPRIDGIYVSNAMCLPVCRALCSDKVSGQVKLVTTDLFKAMAPYFERGTISVSIHQHPYLQGQSAVRMILDHFAQNTPIPSTHYLSPGVVFRSNLHAFRETSSNGRDIEAPRPSGYERVAAYRHIGARIFGEG